MSVKNSKMAGGGGVVVAGPIQQTTGGSALGAVSDFFGGVFDFVGDIADSAVGVATDVYRIANAEDVARAKANKDAYDKTRLAQEQAGIMAGQDIGGANGKFAGVGQIMTAGGAGGSTLLMAGIGLAIAAIVFRK